MKFLRSGSIKEKFIDFMAKGLFLGVCALFFLWMVSGAKAASNELSDIKFSKGAESTEIELQTKESVSEDNIAVDFQRNFIQFSLKGVSAFPSKTVAIRNKPVEKAFSYQYQPDLARVRILLNGSSRKYADKISWSVEGSAIRIQIPTIATGAASGITSSAPAAAKDRVVSRLASSDKAESTTPVDADEIAARNELLKSNDSTVFQKASATTANNSIAASSSGEKKEVKSLGEDTPLFLKSTEDRKVKEKEEKSPASKIGIALAGILAAISLLSLGYKKYILGGKLIIQKPHQILDVVATQSLGKQKSISIVRVMDRHLVLGITDQSVNLLMDLGADSNIDKYLDSSPIGASFGDFLARTATTQSSSASPAESINPSQGFRQLMKKKISGLKPLQG